MEEKKERPSLPFGKEIKIGNYKVLKFTKSLSRDQLKALRKTAGNGGVKGLSRAGIPYIKVEAISGIFALTFCFNTQVFRWLDYCIPVALEAQEKGETLAQNSVADILHVFGMWMTDVCTTGDQKYYEDKANSLKALIDRQRPAGVKSEANASETVAESAEEKAVDDKVLEDVKADEEAKAKLVEMSKEVADGEK